MKQKIYRLVLRIDVSDSSPQISAEEKRAIELVEHAFTEINFTVGRVQARIIGVWRDQIKFKRRLSDERA